MKIYIAVAVIIIAIIPVSLKADSVKEFESTDPKPQVEEKTERLNSRLEEINAMDKSEMSGEEKKELRKEAKAAKKGLSQTNGVFLSLGAIIVIVLLLIILV